MNAAHLLARAGAAAMQGARRHRLGAAAPTISISGTVLIGETLTASATDTTSYEWRRDGVAIPSATASTYVVTADDIGPELTCVATGPGGATESNALLYDDAAHLPDTAIGVSTAGLTLADSDTTVDAWAATLGGKAVSLTLSALSAAARPAYAATGGAGGRPLLTWDGAGDVLRATGVTFGGTWSGLALDVVGVLAGPETSGDRIMRFASGDLFTLGTQGTPVATLVASGAGGATSVGSTVITGSQRLMTAEWDGATQSVAINGTVEDSDANTHAAYADGVVIALGADAGGGGSIALSAQAWAVSRGSLTSTQRTHLRALLTYHTGVSC